MQLTWYGTASLLLQEKNTIIAFDPFSGIPMNKRKRQRSLPYAEAFQSAQNIFITHGHFDHIYHLPILYRDTDVKIHCTKTPFASLVKRKMNRDKLIEIAPGFQKEIGSFQITAFQGRHCQFDKPLVQKKLRAKRTWLHFFRLLYLGILNASYPENEEILFYEVCCGDKRIQIMGSMNLDEQTVYPTGADILILPLQGRSDQDEYALQFAERLQPKRILLDHYDDAFGPLSDAIDTSGFEKNVRERLGIPCQPLIKGETIYE
jgi:L-ascorbate metabolism protein UlaG (beta-lactamase superfamily)